MLISTYKNAVATWLHKRIVDPLLQILRRGAEPKQLAFSTALGMTLGIFPICGVTVFLCGMAIALLGSLCHAPSMMLANFIATPIELSLVVPFLRFGEVIIGGPHFPLTSDALRKVLTGQASRDVLQSIVNALLGWLVAAPFILATLYIIFLPCFKLLVRKFSTVPLSPNKPLHSHTDTRLKKVCVNWVMMQRDYGPIHPPLFFGIPWMYSYPQQLFIKLVIGLLGWFWVQHDLSKFHSYPDFIFQF